MANIPGFPGYAGWGQTEAEADFRATGGSGKEAWRENGGQSPSSGGGSSFNYDPVEQAKKIRAFNIEANQPAIKALESEKQPLIDRYKNLVDQIKGNQQTAETRQTRSTANELGRRGIIGGGAYDEEFVNALNPITQQYTGMIKDTQSGQESDLLAIAKQIAALEAGSPDTSMSQSLQYGGLQQQAWQTQKQMEEDRALKEAQALYYKNMANTPSQTSMASGLSSLWSRYGLG